MKDKVIRDFIVKDYWLYGKVKISQTKGCQECGRSECINIDKGNDLSKLIRVLKKFNYKGIPKKKADRR